MLGPRGLWFAVPAHAPASPPIARLKAKVGPLADAYFYRALAFAKLYQQNGQLGGSWIELADFIMWPDPWEDLRSVFRAAGIVVGGRDLLYSWADYNGWLLARYERDRVRQVRRRRAAKRAAKTRKQRLKEGRKVGRTAAATKRGRSKDRPRTETDQ